jgi:hypothetical protein
MPASLGQLTANRARLERTFDDGESFFIEYRPMQLTPRQLHVIHMIKGRAWDTLTEAEQEAGINATTRLLADCLIATDATTSAGEPIICTYEGLQDVTIVDLTALLDLIMEDQRLGKANGSARSQASSTPPSASLPSPVMTVSPTSANGTSSSRSRSGSASRSSRS